MYAQTLRTLYMITIVFVPSFFQHVIHAYCSLSFMNEHSGLDWVVEIEKRQENTICKERNCFIISYSNMNLFYPGNNACELLLEALHAVFQSSNQLSSVTWCTTKLLNFHICQLRYSLLPIWQFFRKRCRPSLTPVLNIEMNKLRILKVELIWFIIPKPLGVGQTSFKC